MRLAVVSPVRNEAEHLDRTIESVVRQSHRPLKWVIVDDGSTDGTGALADEAARLHPWIRVVHREDRGFRKSGSGVMDAFQDGMKLVQAGEWDVVAKLDGDLEFDAAVFATLMEAFSRNPKLGICGGDIVHEQDGQIVVESWYDPKFHVRGATKFYVRKCWEAIGGLMPVTGWDTLDEVKATMMGWETRRVPEARFFHLRPTGAADGGWKNAFKNGRGSYVCGYHPLYMISKCLKRVAYRPVLIHSLGLFCGFFSSYFGGVERISDRPLVQYLRKQQLKRLLGMSSTWN